MENEKVLEKLKEQTEKKIEEVMKQGLQPNNIDMLYSLVDIHKDIANEEYWKEKGEHMRYSRGYTDHRGMEYDNYGRRERDSRGRYKDGMSDRRYRGHEMIDDMYKDYTEYHEGKEQFRRNGSYGAKEDTMKSLEYMLESVYCFVEMLFDEAETPEETQMIKHYAKKISEL